MLYEFVVLIGCVFGVLFDVVVYCCIVFVFVWLFLVGDGVLLLCCCFDLCESEC